MKQKLFIALVVILIFLIGRWTSPPKVVEDTHKLDSLKRDIIKRGDALQKSQDSVRHLTILAETWFQEAEKLRKNPKITIRYEKARIDVLPDSALFKQFSAIYPDN